jgi:acetolactate synthase-1/2/3 large subunit
MMLRSGADVVAEALAALRVRHAFCIVSIHNMPILDAIRRRGVTELIDVRHEQAGAHAADGYARATGELGVMIASTGPGTTNTVTGLYEAAYASSPVLLITGQAETGFYGRGLGYVHEAEQQLPMLRTVTRAVESPRRAADVAPALARLVHAIRSGRAQPGAIEIPIDVQYADAGTARFEAPTIVRTTADETILATARDALAQSRRRVILAGGGAIAAGAQDALRVLAERLDAPVITTVNGRGVLPEDEPRCIGNLYQSRGIASVIAEADLTLAVGTRFQAGVDGGNQRLVPPGRLVHIDVDPAVIGRAHRADIAVVGDARLVLEALLEGFAAAPNDGQFNAAIYETRDGVRDALRNRLGSDYRAILDSLTGRLDASVNVVRDTTVPAYNFGNQLLPIRAPRTSMSPTSAAIGPGLPMAIGAAVGSGRRTVVIHGDGGFMFHATELATAAQYQVPVVVCVFNDGGYGVLRGLQHNRFEGRVQETDLGVVDFVAMGEAMGVPGFRVKTAAAFDAALATALAMPGPYLLDIDMLALEPMKGSMLPQGAREGTGR